MSHEGRGYSQATKPSGPHASDLWSHYHPLFAAAQRITGNAADAEDIAQECLLKALEWRPRQQRPMNWRGWLLTVARHRAIDLVRRRRRESSEPLDEAAQAASQPDDSGACQAEADYPRVRLALGALPGELRRVLELHYLQQLNYRELAGRLGVTTGAVATRLHRAREAARLALE